MVFKLHIARQHVLEGYQSVDITLNLDEHSWETEINCLFGGVTLSVHQQSEGIPWKQMFFSNYGIITENETWNDTQNQTSMIYVESFTTCATSLLNYSVPNNSLLITYSFK